MELGKSTENLAPKMSSDNTRLHLVLVVISLVVAIVALLVSCVGISMKGTTNLVLPEYPVQVNSAQASQSGSTQGTQSAQSSPDDKIWSIAIGHANFNEAYIFRDEESGRLKGFLVDFTNAVCKIGNKNCRIVYDVWTRCWDSEAGQVARGGVGLMSDWYDACTGWYGTYDRYRTYAFTDAYGKGDPESLYVKPGSPLASTWKNMANKKIGILDGWWTDEFCLNRNADAFSSGAPFDGNLIKHYADPTDLVDAVMNGIVDYAFQSNTGYVATQLERVAGDPVLPCAVHGQSTMTRKVNQEFLNWWNEAQKRLMATSEYAAICRDLEEEHGHMPGISANDYCFI